MYCNCLNKDSECKRELAYMGNDTTLNLSYPETQGSEGIRTFHICMSCGKAFQVWMDFKNPDTPIISEFPHAHLYKLDEPLRGYLFKNNKLEYIDLWGHIIIYQEVRVVFGTQAGKNEYVWISLAPKWDDGAQDYIAKDVPTFIPFKDGVYEEAKKAIAQKVEGERIIRKGEHTLHSLSTELRNKILWAYKDQVMAKENQNASVDGRWNKE